MANLSLYERISLGAGLNPGGFVVIFVGTLDEDAP
jgi:hypothetical protein